MLADHLLYHYPNYSCSKGALSKVQDAIGRKNLSGKIGMRRWQGENGHHSLVFPAECRPYSAGGKGLVAQTGCLTFTSLISKLSMYRSSSRSNAMASATSNPACHYLLQLLSNGQALTSFHTCILISKLSMFRSSSRSICTPKSYKPLSI